MALLEKNKASITAQRIEYEKSVAKVSVVGAGVQSNPGVAARMFEAIYNVGINIRMIATSEIRITVLVNEGEEDKAARAVHEAFLEVIE